MAAGQDLPAFAFAVLVYSVSMWLRGCIIDYSVCLLDNADNPLQCLVILIRGFWIHGYVLVGIMSSFSLGTSLRDRLRQAVRLRVSGLASGSEDAREASQAMVADVLSVRADRASDEFVEFIGQATGAILSLVKEYYRPRGVSPIDLGLWADTVEAMRTQEAINQISIALVNDGLHHLGSDIRCALTSQGLSIFSRGGGLPQFPGGESLWDELGLPRETDVRRESWNPNGISTFFHQLDFSDFRYLEAVNWRTGYVDRQSGEHRFRFVEEYDATPHPIEMVNILETSDERERKAATRAEYFADVSDEGSLWYQIARQWRMKDHMILAFETNRTRPIETVDLSAKYDLRERYYSKDPRVAMAAKSELAAWAFGRDNAIPDVEAVLGRPYYELVDLDVTEGEVVDGVNLSVSAAVDDIVDEAVRAMLVLHVRPYIFWASETELMMAAARPGSNIGPWSRADLEAAVTLVPSTADSAAAGGDGGLLTWTSIQRAAHEPGYDWVDVQADNARLRQYWVQSPDLEYLLDSESYSEEDRVLMHRLVRLSRFGYGLPAVRKPEYRRVHILP